MDAPPKGKRRSTTHGVGWYGNDDSGELRRPPGVRVWKIIALIAALVAAGAVGGIIYMWSTGR